jgi:hypothetical protein
MRVRSLPHFAHKAIGKSTHKKGTSYAHVNYITREEACSKTIGEHMPADRDGARPFFERMANKEGVAANARIADTIIIALPIEMTPAQRHEAIAGFMQAIGKGRIAWLAAFHDLGKDAHNPHCHLIFRDADVDTGRKVVGTTTSAKDVKEAEAHGWRVPPRMTTADLRKAWCDHLNGETQRHGIDVRFDQRRLKERGIEREPEIHVGPKAMSMAKNGRDFASRDRLRALHANAYALMDEGSRAEHNLRIIEANRRLAHVNGKREPPRAREAAEKAALRAQQAAERKSMYGEQMQDRAALRHAQHAQKLAHQRWARALYAEARGQAYQGARAANTKAWEVQWAAIRRIGDKNQRKAAETAQKAAQKGAYEQAAAARIEQARPIKNEAWHTLLNAQEAERLALQRRHGVEATALARQHVAERQALAETWRHQHLDRQAQRTAAQLQNRPTMAPVQTAAVAMIRLHADSRRPRSAETRAGIPAHPLEAVRFFTACAVAEREKRAGVRAQLSAERTTNLAARSTERTRASGRANASADVLPLTERNRADPQSDLRQAVQSGRTLSDGERANLSAGDRAQGAGQPSSSNKREQQFLAFLAQRSGKGRNGGRSGR